MGANRRQGTSRRRLMLSLLIAVGVVAVGLLIFAAATGLLFSEPETETVAIPIDTPIPEPAGDVTPSGPDEPVEPVSKPDLPNLRVGYRVSERAPDFTLQSLSGDSVSLSQFLGQVVILDFWASWCTPCRTSMPDLHTLWNEVRDQGVVLVGVSLDRSEAAASGYLEQTGYAEMVALYESTAASSKVARSYGVIGIPRTFVIDRDGIIRFAGHPGNLSRLLLDSTL